MTSKQYERFLKFVYDKGDCWRWSGCAALEEGEAQMSRTNVKITKHNSTIAVQANSYKESFDAAHMSKDQIVNTCYWIFITGGVRMSTESIAELLRENKVLA